MKVNLELKFKLPEDREEYYQYVNATKLGAALWEITHNLKKECEREANMVVTDGVNIYDGIDIVFDRLYKILEEYNIDTNELT